jgi:uncharacterized membrane protein
MEYSVLGFVVIVILYAVIGLMAAGAVFTARKFLTHKAEQIFYAMFLIMIARVLPRLCGLLPTGDGMAA